MSTSSIDSSNTPSTHSKPMSANPRPTLTLKPPTVGGAGGSAPAAVLSAEMYFEARAAHSDVLKNIEWSDEEEGGRARVWALASFSAVYVKRIECDADRHVARGTEPGYADVAPASLYEYEIAIMLATLPLADAAIIFGANPRKGVAHIAVAHARFIADADAEDLRRLREDRWMRLPVLSSSAPPTDTLQAPDSPVSGNVRAASPMEESDTPPAKKRRPAAETPASGGAGGEAPAGGAGGSAPARRPTPMRTPAEMRTRINKLALETAKGMLAEMLDKEPTELSDYVRRRKAELELDLNPARGAERSEDYDEMRFWELLYVALHQRVRPAPAAFEIAPRPDRGQATPYDRDCAMGPDNALEMFIVEKLGVFRRTKDRAGVAVFTSDPAMRLAAARDIVAALINEYKDGDDIDRDAYEAKYEAYAKKCSASKATRESQSAAYASVGQLGKIDHPPPEVSLVSDSSAGSSSSSSDSSSESSGSKEDLAAEVERLRQELSEANTRCMELQESRANIEAELTRAHNDAAHRKGAAMDLPNSQPCDGDNDDNDDLLDVNTRFAHFDCGGVTPGGFVDLVEDKVVDFGRRMVPLEDIDLTIGLVFGPEKSAPHPRPLSEIEIGSRSYFLSGTKAADVTAYSTEAADKHENVTVYTAGVKPKALGGLRVIHIPDAAALRNINPRGAAVLVSARVDGINAAVHNREFFELVIAPEYADADAPITNISDLMTYALNKPCWEGGFILDDDASVYLFQRAKEPGETADTTRLDAYMEMTTPFRFNTEIAFDVPFVRPAGRIAAFGHEMDVVIRKGRPLYAYYGNPAPRAVAMDAALPDKSRVPWGLHSLPRAFAGTERTSMFTYGVETDVTVRVRAFFVDVTNPAVVAYFERLMEHDHTLKAPTAVDFAAFCFFPVAAGHHFDPENYTLFVTSPSDMEHSSRPLLDALSVSGAKVARFEKI